MFRLFIIVCFVLSAITTFSQVYFETKSCPTETYISPMPSTNPYYGTVPFLKVELKNYPNPVKYEIHSLLVGTNTVVFTNLTDSTSGINESLSYRAYAIDTLSLDTVGQMYWYSGSSRDNIDWINFQPSFTNVSCNGIMNAQLLEAGYGGTGVHTMELEYTDLNGVTSNSVVTSLVDTTLCPGNYKIKVLLGSQLRYSSTFSIGAFSNAGFNNPTYTASVFSTPSSDVFCNSSSIATVVGVTSPYQYAFDNGSFSYSNTAVNMCPGVHILTVVDSQNDTLSSYFTVSTDSNSIIAPNPFGNLIIIDSVNYDFQNCSIDYSLPIDSAFMTSYQVIDSNTIYIEGEFWQNGSSYLASDTLVVQVNLLNSNGFLFVSGSVYCLVKQSGAKVFKFYDYVPIGTARLEELNLESIHLSPNPVNDILYLDLEKSAPTRITISDASGKVSVLKNSESESIQINMSNLESGVYFISIEIMGEIITKRVLKN